MANPTESPHNGPERRSGERNRTIIFWALIFICIVVSTGAAFVAHHADKVSEKSEAAHCVLVAALRISQVRSQGLILKYPTDTVNSERQESIKEAQALIDKLKATGIHCSSANTPPLPEAP